MDSYTIQCHSRLPVLVPINSLRRILRHIRVIADYWSYLHSCLSVVHSFSVISADIVVTDKQMPGIT